MKTILVIDDEPIIRELLEEVIEDDLGYKFIGSSRVRKGISELQKKDIDLILLDIQLPQTNGLEGIQMIRETNKTIPIFVISAFHNMENVIDMLDEEVQEFIKKPFDMKYLKQKIRNILGGDLNDKKL